MFENIIAQPATSQLRADIASRRLAPSMLFFGPPASGKGSTAIELARSLSCENAGAPWNCTCTACARHRTLSHADLAMIGPRGFASEIAASRAAFLRDKTSVPGRLLFVRSLRKLLARFMPAVWEYESKSGKANPLSLLQALEEDLDEFESLAAEAPEEKSVALEKASQTLMKNAFKLEGEYLSEAIPIAQVRKAAYWSRLSPAGKQKTLIIENADRMEDKSRNALLKLLEEPPGTISIVLTAQRREALMDTILSRLRPYRFVARSAEQEREIIRRIFREPDSAENKLQGQVSAYLDSFLPQPSEKLLPLAAFFIAAVARSAALAARNQNASLSPCFTALGSYCAPIAESAGLDRASEAKETIAALLALSGNFEGRSFPRFLALALNLVSGSLAQAGPGMIACREIWKKRLGEAHAAYGVWNQRPELALESLFCRLREDMAR